MNLKSFAKVNLYLKVINKRPDGYHTLNTIFERISLADRIVLKPRKDNLIKIICDNKNVPQDEANFCFKAAKLLRDEFRPLNGLDIKITKLIPVGAGLGGGSSNAAAVLLGLNTLWGLKLSKVKLAKFAAKVGSDTAFFIYDLPFAIGSGRGEKIEPLNILKKTKFWHLLVVPKIHVSTPLIYRKYDHSSGLTPPIRNQKAGLTKLACNVKLITPAAIEKKITKNQLVRGVLAKRSHRILKPGLLFNSLEQVTVRLYPEVKRIKDTLLRLGLDRVLMSGSGSAVFAIASSFKNASKLARILKKREKSWRIFVVKTV